ncbi:MAG: hypothetical protein MUF81_21245 [Verrucomicrobia bacterium]|nr:hypothetical protein [Verrucomicrobiota bacterium]
MKDTIGSRKTVAHPTRGQKTSLATRRRNYQPPGYVIDAAGSAATWHIEIPLAVDCLNISEGDFPPEQFAQITHSAGLAGLSIAQYLNKVHRDYFARCDCGDKQSPRTCRALGDNGE